MPPVRIFHGFAGSVQRQTRIASSFVVDWLLNLERVDELVQAVTATATELRIFRVMWLVEFHRLALQTMRRILYYSSCLLSMQHDVKILARPRVRQCSANDAAAKCGKTRAGSCIHFFAQNVVRVGSNVCQHFRGRIAKYSVLRSIVFRCW